MQTVWKGALPVFRRIEVVQILRLLRPAQGREGPQRRGEPGVQGVGVAGQMGAAALGAGGGSFFCHHRLAAFVAVPGRDLMAPPQLAADAPVAGVLHPVHIVFGEALGHKADAALFHRLDGGLGQRLHLDEPLLGDHRLDGGVAAVAAAHLVLEGLDRFEVAAGFEVGDDGLAGLHGGHAGVLAAVQDAGLVDRRLAGGKEGVGGLLVGLAGHVPVVGKDPDDGQIVPQPHLKVVGVVGRGDLDHAGALGHIGVLVADDGDLLVQQRQDDVAAVQVGVAGVVGVDGDGGVAQHGLGAGGGQLQHLPRLLDRVEQVPEMAVLLGVLHLGVRDGGVAVGAPVDHPVAAVDQALVIQPDKDLPHRVGAALVHGKALPLPVAAAAQLFQLADDAAAVAVLPVPGALQKAVPAHHLLGQALLGHGLDDLGLGGDGGVVGAGHPEGGVALHPLVADEDILHGVVHRVAHVQLPGDVGGRHDDGVGLFVRVGLGVEIAALLPELVDAVLHLAGVVLFCEFFHGIPPL